MIESLLSRLGVSLSEYLGAQVRVCSPIDGSEIACLRAHTSADVESSMVHAEAAFRAWCVVPAPVRGELIRLFGEELRRIKEDLALLITIETGKILSEGRGEVQEMIDICDFAVGLSRQLYGLTIASERPGHHMREMWHPLGPVGVISAFNFPVAVWAWNAALAIVCGDSVVWKPSEKTPVSALACQSIFEKTVLCAREKGLAVPEYLCQTLIGRSDIGEALVKNPHMRLISATGNTAMGRHVAAGVGLRRHLLELGGNAGMILTPSANLELARRAILFGAVGTAGQRCTTLRRLIIHESIADAFLPKLTQAYESLRIGDPRTEGVLIGPLIDQPALAAMQKAIEQAGAQGGVVITGGDPVLSHVPEKGAYVRPVIIRMPAQTEIVRHETFAPILYVMTYKNLDDAIVMNNDVPQGLSSCIFTQDVNEAEKFLSASGSDCGIANVNIGPSGAEIGGAFGGEKETGGGRESGSDSWKYYMRRQTQTVNYSGVLPLAQGVVFGD